jgi:hypothetical protein
MRKLRLFFQSASPKLIEVILNGPGIFCVYAHNEYALRMAAFLLNACIIIEPEHPELRK